MSIMQTYKSINIMTMKTMNLYNTNMQRHKNKDK